jgi:hypothetical protein
METAKLQPLPVERGLQADADWPVQCTEEVDESVEHDGHVLRLGQERAGRVECTRRDVPLMQIEPHESHRSLRIVIR